ncbi:hypothetical protein B0H19DRAFT_1085800 [Mycena capillaripes]|nr:hypothetical protein B0H19DRAFT_1085800 [Mycena capillaripes]
MAVVKTEGEKGSVNMGQRIWRAVEHSPTASRIDVFSTPVVVIEAHPPPDTLTSANPFSKSASRRRRRPILCAGTGVKIKWLPEEAHAIEWARSVPGICVFPLGAELYAGCNNGFGDEPPADATKYVLFENAGGAGSLMQLYSRVPLNFISHDSPLAVYPPGPAGAKRRHVL